MIISKDTATILVSGAGGFLGREILKQLLNCEKFNIIAITSQKKLLLKEYKNIPRLLVVDKENWKNEVNKNLEIDILVNCAFPRTSDPEQLALGLTFTEKLLKDVSDYKIKAIINISSQSVYTQKSKDLINEKSSIVPETLYAMSKYSTERIVTTFCENSNSKIAFSNIRLASLVGKELEVRMTNRFIKSAIEGKPININGGSQKVSYLHVSDAANGIVKMINSDKKTWNEVYNLGNNEFCSVMELARIVKSVAEGHLINDVKINTIDCDQNFSNLINSDLFYEHFNWKPSYNMVSIIEDLFKYYIKSV